MDAFSTAFEKQLVERGLCSGFAAQVLGLSFADLNRALLFLRTADPLVFMPRSSAGYPFRSYPSRAYPRSTGPLPRHRAPQEDVFAFHELLNFPIPQNETRHRAFLNLKR